MLAGRGSAHARLVRAHGRERPSRAALSVRPAALAAADLGGAAATVSRSTQLLRHPEARRAGDRAALLRHVNALVRAARCAATPARRAADDASIACGCSSPATRAIKGKKAAALVAFVREQPGVPRADALLAGFSNAVIARAVKAGRAARGRPRAAPRGRTERAIAAAAVARRRPNKTARCEWIDGGARRARLREALLHGVTGSGKTFVYVEAIERVVREGGRAIVLVPEISLTPQTARRFEAAFGDRVAVLHSALSERERFDAWQACARGEIDVVVGARSAVFAPARPTCG